MVDSISSGGVGGVVASKNDPVAERRDRREQEIKADEARERDVVELSEQAQGLAQVEDTARQARRQIEKTDEPLSGGRINTLV